MSDVTALSDAFARVGITADETPQQAAERIWKATGKDPVETMRLFNQWAMEEPDRMAAVLGHYWPRLVRAFLERDGNRRPNGWAFGNHFYKRLHRIELKDKNALTEEYRRGYYGRVDSDDELASKISRNNREYYRRKARGIKRVSADVDVATGTIALIDKEFGPFAHIRVNGMALPEVTSEDALAHCDRTDTDARFIRALCQMIPDPRKPIGEQWTADMIRQATRIAQRNEATS